MEIIHTSVFMRSVAEIKEQCNKTRNTCNYSNRNVKVLIGFINLITIVLLPILSTLVILTVGSLNFPLLTIINSVLITSKEFILQLPKRSEKYSKTISRCTNLEMNIIKNISNHDKPYYIRFCNAEMGRIELDCGFNYFFKTKKRPTNDDIINIANSEEEKYQIDRYYLNKI
jgi:hypothetical protein